MRNMHCQSVQTVQLVAGSIRSDFGHARTTLGRHNLHGMVALLLLYGFSPIPAVYLFSAANLANIVALVTVIVVAECLFSIARNESAVNQQCKKVHIVLFDLHPSATAFDD